MAMVVTIIVDTVGTMSTEVRTTRRWLMAVSVFGIGLLLLAISGPRILAYAQMAMVPSSVARSLESGRDISTTGLDEAIARYENATFVLSHDFKLLQDLGRLEMRRAAGLKDPTQRSEELRSALVTFEAAIAAAPARPFPWSLDAYARSELSVPSEEVVGLLRMSYFLGPQEASSIMLRARVGGRMWNFLDDGARQFTENDFRKMWQYSILRPALIDIYLENTLTARAAIRRAVLIDKSEQKKFDRLIEKTLGDFKSRSR